MNGFPERMVHGSGVTITLDPTRMLVVTKKPVERTSLTASVSAQDLSLESDRSVDVRGRPEQSRRGGEQVNESETQFWMRTQTANPVSEGQLDALRSELGNDLDWIGPVYQVPNVPGRGGLICPLPNVLLVRTTASREPVLDRRVRKAITDAGLTENEEKSKYLPGYRYYTVNDPEAANAYEIRDRLLAEGGRGIDVRLETVPMIKPTTAVPNDTLFPQQWDMTQIRAGGTGSTGWDLETGSNTVVIAILDEGIDRGHPDLRVTAAGVNLGTMGGDGSPTGNHGTPCAGIAAARYNNAAGIAGVAGGCQVMPIAFQNWSDVECAAGIAYAAANGADVISMSFGVYAPGDGMGPTGWDFAIIDPAIATAVDTNGLVLCAATGNEDFGAINRYPSRNERVIACGASDQADNRKSPASPDGETWWGSNFGPGMDVMAPGVLIPSTDRLGAAGYENPGDYMTDFNGTSAATPHVAGFAALLISEFPSLSNQGVRDIIERTAAKVGTTAYVNDPARPNGPTNAQMGYGRIDVHHGLDFADVSIGDWWGDTGSEPSSPPGGNFWTYSDIAVRITDDGVFAPEDPAKSSSIERGQTNYLYVRVRNHGPAVARNVVVDARVVAYVGTEFVYPLDWTATDAQHVAPTPVTASFASIPAGGQEIAKFTISASQVEGVWGWVSGHSWHPCIVAVANAANDYAFASASTAGGALITRRNNFAQRNVSVIDVLASATVTFPFLMGTIAENNQEFLEVEVDRSHIPHNVKVELLIDQAEQDFRPGIVPEIFRNLPRKNGIQFDRDSFRFLDPVRVELRSGAGVGLMQLERGSRLATAAPASRARLHVTGGEEVIRGANRLVRIDEAFGRIRFDRDSGQQQPASLRMTIPAGATPGDTFPLTVSQRGADGQIIGGATVIYRVRD